MTTKDDYTPDEWRTLYSLPLQASLSVIASGKSGPIQMLKEGMAAAASLAAGTSAGSPLVAAVAAETNERYQERQADADPDTRPQVSQDLEHARSDTLDMMAKVNEILAVKSTPEEADAYKRWVLDVARKTAAAAKEGSFLGFGGTQVSAEEHEALASIATVLGIPLDT